jgi:hypothetical protein
MRDELEHEIRRKDERRSLLTGEILEDKYRNWEDEIDKNM